MIKAVIFDFDYTLGDSTEGIVLCVNTALQQLGCERKSVNEIRRMIGLSLKETYYSLTSDKTYEKAEQFAELFMKEANEVMLELTELYNDTVWILQQLKHRGFLLGIVSTKMRHQIDKILEKFHIEDLIDIVVGAEDVAAEKPSPEGLIWAIERLKLEKENVLYVGDSVVDAKTARNAKVPFAGVLTGTTTRQELEQYEHVLIANTISEIYRKVEVGR